MPTNTNNSKLCKIICVILTCLCIVSFASAQKSITIAITKIVDHPSLDQAQRGIIDSLNQAGYIEKKNLKIIVESANGSIATANQIAQKFVSLKPDAIIAISTISAKTCAKAAKGSNIPVIFSSVTDPKSAGLLGIKGVTGATDSPPVGLAIELIKEIFPNIKKLGVVYNAGEDGSVSTITKLKALAPELTVIEATANSSNEVSTAAKSLSGKVEAIFIPLDNTVVGALESLLKVTNAAKIPVISNDPEHVSRTGIAVISNNTDDVARGIVAAIGFSQYAVGKVAGEKLLKVLNGTPIANISVSPPSNHELHINVKQAKQLGISLDKQLLGRAHTIIGG